MHLRFNQLHFSLCRQAKLKLTILDDVNQREDKYGMWNGMVPVMRSENVWKIHFHLTWNPDPRSLGVVGCGIPDRSDQQRYRSVLRVEAKDG